MKKTTSNPNMPIGIWEFFFKIFDNLSRSFSIAKTIKNSNLIMTLITLAIISNFGVAHAQVTPVIIPNGGFHIDGNLNSNNPDVGIGDWVQGPAGTGGYLFNNLWIPLNDATTVRYLDAYNGGDDMFAGGDKFNDNPNSWGWKTSKATGKNDINNTLIHLGADSDKNQWLFIATDRLETNGTSYIDFEFFQKPIVSNSDGSFTSDGISGGRTLGDLLITVEYAGGGSVVSISTYLWESVGSGYGYVLQTTPNAYGQTNTINAVTLPESAFGQDFYLPYQFVEAAINMSLLFEQIDPCLGGEFGSILVKTKSSVAPSADLEDFAGPFPVKLNLGIATIAYNSSDLCSSSATPDIDGVTGGSFSFSPHSENPSAPALYINTNTGEITITENNRGFKYIVKYDYNTGGCPKTTTTVINIPTIPTITGTTPSSRCGTGTITLGATASAGIINWYSDAIEGTPVGTGTSFTTPSISETTTYYVDATVVNGCITQTRTAVTATINPLPIINEIVALNPTIATCPILNNGSITINATGTNLQYSINNGISYQSSNVFNGLTSGTYQISVKNSITNCLAYYPENVVLNNPICISDVSIVATANASEPNTNGLFTLTLTNPLVINTEITYTITGTAANGTDYSIIGTTVTVLANQPSVIIPVNVIDDDIIEATETVIITLTGTNNLVNVDPNNNTATVTITDNDGGDQNGISINNVTVNEGDGNATFMVTLTGNVQDGFTVDYATANNSAIATSDFTQTSGTLTFVGTTGEAQTITVPIIDDNLIEPTENFFVNLSDLSTVLIDINDAQGIGTIEDNDGGNQNGISINNLTVNEGDGNAIFTVTLSGNVQGGFTVDYATSNNSAMAPGDFTQTSGTLNFIGTNGETKNITVPIIDDNFIELTETFFVNLSDLSTVLIGINDAQGIGTILDNDGGDQNGISINNVIVNEGDGNAIFTVTLTGNVQGGFTVDYATANNSAMAPGDFTQTSGTLNFAGTNGETKNITVPIIDDNLIEPTENFFVNLSDLSTVLIGINDAQGIGTILDNDGGSQNGLTINDVTVNEGDGNATFTVTLTGNVQGGFTVDYATANNSAIAASDYTQTSGTLTFLGTNGETKNITVPIIDDNFIEPSENFFVNLSDLSTVLIGINDAQGIGTILDNDGGDQNGISINNVTVNEGDGNATFTVTLTGNVQGGFTIDYATANNSAIAASDFTQTSGTLTFVGTTGEVQTITVPIIDDNLIEPTENFFVNLSDLSTVLIGINDAQGIGTILDNDGGDQNGISINNVTVNEEDGNATFTVTLAGNVQGGFTVDYATANNSAMAPVDFTQTSGTLTFNGTTGETHNVVVPIIDDNWIEPTENFLVNLSELSTDLIGINDNQGIGTITDNDGGSENGLTINDVTVNEDAGNATFTVTLTGNVQGGFTVDFVTANGSAIAPGDYTATSGTLTFNGTTGETHNVVVPIIDDNLIEPAENFLVNLSELSTDLIGINDNQGIGTITDNDGGSENGLTINNVTVNEGDGNAIFTVTLTGNVQGGFTVDYATANNSAIAPGDYTATSGTLTFSGTNGETHNITAPIIDDNLIEPAENFFVNLSELSTNLIEINENQGIGTIMDNDGGSENGLTINDVSVNEDAGNATFTVTLTGNVQGGFTVDFATANGSAIAPGDYTATSGTLTFVGTNGETQNITVPIIDDNLIELTENFSVNLSELSTNLIGINDIIGIGTIIDNDLNVNNDTAIAIDSNPTTIDILANDLFGSDDTIESVVISSNPEHGTVTIDSNNNVIYTANDGYFGPDTFNYTLTVVNTDGSLNSGTATVTVTVNVSPNAADDLAETESNIPINIDILDNDTDADGTIDPTSVTIIDAPENGTVVINTNGTVTYTPNLDFIGDDIFTYEVCDNDGLCDTATVNVIVAGVLAAELIIPEGFSPNDDGVHDEFDVEGLANLYPDFKMTIFNRWGVEVYDYTHNGNPLSEPIWWDGYSRGRMTLGNGPAPVGTYFYILYFNKDGAKPRSGYLYLNR